VLRIDERCSSSCLGIIFWRDGFFPLLIRISVGASSARLEILTWSSAPELQRIESYAHRVHLHNQTPCAIAYILSLYLHLIASNYSSESLEGLTDQRATMTELSFAKSFLQTLDARPSKLSPTHVEDPKTYPARGAVRLPTLSHSLLLSPSLPSEPHSSSPLPTLTSRSTSSPKTPSPSRNAKSYPPAPSAR